MLHPLRRPERGWFLALAGALVLGGALVQPARAADTDKRDNSLDWIPADASFYSTMLHNREQFQIIAKSKAWATLKSLPAVKKLWAQAKEQYTAEDGKLAPLRKFYEQEENKELVEVLLDAMSEEVFCYGGPSVNDLTELAVDAYVSLRYGPALKQLTGNAGGLNQQQLQVQAVLETLAANTKLIKAPDMVLGFKVSDPKKAAAQVKRLEALARAVIQQQAPMLKGRLKRVQVGDADLLTLTLDGSMVPWDQIPWKDYEDKAGEYDALRKRLSELKLAVSIGVRGNYLLVALGTSPEVVSQLGGKGELLVNRPEFKPLAKFTDKRLTGIGYVSAALRGKVNSSKKDWEGLSDLAQAGLDKLDLAKEQRQKIEKDVSGLVEYLKQNTARVGAEVAFSFLTDRGYEGYSYDYGEHPGLDGSKPLALLNHVGGNPIFAIVGRGKSNPAAYAEMVKWARTAFEDVNEIAEAKLPEEAKAKYKEVVEAVIPLLKRADAINRTLLIPALTDGQWAFVLDAKWTSKQWLALIPETDKPMPLPELAVVLGVTDAAKLRKGMADYLTLVNDTIAKIRELAPNVPESLKVPDPEVTKGTNGTLFSYPFPEIWGVDKQVVPTAGLSEKVAVLTLSHEFAERLLGIKPLGVKGGPLADRKRPLARAVSFNWPALVDAVTPWVELGVEKAELQAAAGGEQSEYGNVLEQTRTVLKVLKVLRGVTAASYFEGKVLVTHTESVFRDLP